MSSKSRTDAQASWTVSLVAALGFLLLYVPLLLLVLGSFFQVSAGVPQYRLDQFTLDWYRQLFSNPEILEAFELSLVVGLWSALGSTVLGTCAALSLSWGNFPGKRLFSFLTHIPLMMPEIVLGLSLLIWFVLLNMTLGLVSMVFAHITFSTSYVLMTVKTRLDGFDHTLLEAARDLGASPWQSFLRVTLPLIFPGILAGALMAFTLSFDDFLITFFTSGAGMDTLPLKIYAMIKFGVTPEVNALSTLLLVTTGVIVWSLFGWVGAKSKF